MGFLAPMIGAAIGGIAATAVGQAVIGIGISLGAGYLARRLQPKPQTQAQGMRLSLRIEPNGSREIAFGRVASAGDLKYHNTYGPNGNDYVQLVFALSDHECDGLEAVYVNGKAVTLQTYVTTAEVSGQPVAEYPGTMWVSFHSGAWGQPADADLVSKSADGSFTASFRGRGVCYARVTLKFDAEAYAAGRPEFLFIFRGAKLYDWRKDSTAGGSGAHRWGNEATYQWTDNPFVVAYNYRRGIYVNGSHLGGMNTPAGSLPVEHWTAAANACDELVTLKAGGSEKRYRLNGIVPVLSEHRPVLADMMATAAAVEIDSGGVYKPLAGVAQAPVMTITDDDLMATHPVEIVPKLSRASLVNTVFGSFNDPAQMYEQVALPPRISPTDVADDGGATLSENYGLAYVTSGTQGQRILEILRRKGRHQRRITARLRSRFAVLEAGDWVTWSSARYGFEDATFEVMQATLDRDLTVSIVLREVAAGIFAWTAGADELDPENPRSVAAGGSNYTTVAGIALANLTIESPGGLRRPGLNVQWTPITDRTVTDLECEFRKVGDTVALATPLIVDPSTGSYTWVTGVQSGTEYEARLRPVTMPKRGVAWSAWVSPGAASSNQVVAVAAYAETVNPAGIPPAVLNAQEKFELSLITQTDDVLGSVSQQIADTVASAEKAHAATVEALLGIADNRASIRVEQRLREQADITLAEQITTVLATFDTQSAQVQSQLTAIAGEVDAQAAAIQTVTTAVEGQTAQVIVLAESINGIEGKFGVAVTANKEVLGLVQLDGNAVAGSTFTVVADNFKVSKPGASGGAAVPVFALQTVNGVTKLALRGDMLADGTITAQKINVASLSALTANLGVVTAGLIRDAANVYNWNVANGAWIRTDGTWTFDAKNKIIDIQF